MAVLTQDSATLNCPPALESSRDSKRDDGPACELSERTWLPRVQRRDRLALLLLLGSFLFMAAMNLWNLFTALFR